MPDKYAEPPALKQPCAINPEVVQRVVKFRHEHRFHSESSAVNYLLAAGLAAMAEETHQ